MQVHRMNAVDQNCKLASKEWYLVYTKPRQEYIAQQNLLRQGYEVFLPEARDNGRGRNSLKKVISPLFPRYLFINLDQVFDQWGPIRSTMGVSKMVSFGTLPLAVPKKLIEIIKAKTSVDGWIEIVEPKMVYGQAVRITSGAMQGYEAIFAAPSGSDRVVILLNVIGQQTRVVIPKSFVEAIV